MRDKEFNFSMFVDQLEKFFLRESHRTNELRSQVVNNPNFLSDYTLYLRDDLQSILSLSLSSWFLPEELGFVIREEIRDRKLKKFSLEDQTLIGLFLKNKTTLLLFLEDTNLYHTRDFFGNFLSEVRKELGFLRFIRNGTKVEKPIRKRGYHDHGTLVPSSKWLPKFDFSLTEKQNRLEEDRDTQENTLEFIIGYLS